MAICRKKKKIETKEKNRVNSIFKRTCRNTKHQVIISSSTCLHRNTEFSYFTPLLTFSFTLLFAYQNTQKMFTFTF